MGSLLAKYATALTIQFPMIKAGTTDFAISTDWTPVTGDTKITLDGADVVNTTNSPASVGGTGSALWSLTLTAAELTSKRSTVQIIDAATKMVVDNAIIIETYGNASAQYPFDFSIPLTTYTGTIPNLGSGATIGDNATDIFNKADAVLTDTAVIGAAGAGLTAIPWNAAWDAEVESEVNDALNTAIAELGVGIPAATPTIRTALMLLYMALRNKLDVETSGTPDVLEVHNDAGTIIAKKSLTDSGGDYSEAKMESG